MDRSGRPWIDVHEMADLQDFTTSAKMIDSESIAYGAMNDLDGRG